MPSIPNEPAVIFTRTRGTFALEPNNSIKQYDLAVEGCAVAE